MLYFSCILGRDWFCGFFFCCGTPQAIGSFLRNRIGNHTREVPSCFYLGVFSIQCACIALIYLFLCRLCGHDFPVVSYRSKFCLSLSIYFVFLSFSSCMRVFLSQSRVHTGFPGIVAYARKFTENSHICPDFLLFWKIKCWWVSLGDCWFFFDASGICISPLFLTKDSFLFDFWKMFLSLHFLFFVLRLVH